MTDILRSTRAAAAFAVPFLAYHLKGTVTPVLAGYKITHKCNLRCKHCPYWKRSGTELDFAGVVAVLRRMAGLGIKILILEGGEPLLWRDGKKSIGHVLEEARKLFPAVCITTNGTLPWGHLPLDRTWVSLDGPRSVHDAIRGDGVFDTVLSHIAGHGCDQTFVSTTVNTMNRESIPDLLTMLRGVAAGATIQFHYPYQGLPDPLFVPVKERRPLLDELIRLKSLGYPVANSVGSLRELSNERWFCEDGLLANAEPDGTITQGCYLKNRGEAQCSRCGFSAHNEMSLAFRGSLQAILTGTRIFFSTARPRTLP